MPKYRFVLLILLLASCVFSANIVETIGEQGNEITVVYLKGSPYQMGYIHGSLFKDVIPDLYNAILGAAKEYASLTLLDIAYNQMEPYIPEAYKQEMQGLADGAGVDVKTVHRIHAIPDLSELDCTFFAAWGNATVDGALVQIRALDYATGLHLQEHPAILVCQPDSGRRFVNVGWLGFIGVVSGMNYDGIEVSEIGDDFDRANQSLAGEPMPFVLRDVIQYTQTLDEAVSLVKNALRTSSYLFCIGDAKIPAARSLKTGRTVFEVYSDETNPNALLDDVVYFSMGVGSSWNNQVYNFLQPKHGNIDVNTGIELMQQLGTGDLHSVAYDPAHNRLFVANAGVDETDAFRRSFVEFDLGRADSIFADYSVTGITEKDIDIPDDFVLGQNYPNPFNGETQIDVLATSPENGSDNARISIYDVQGRLIRILHPSSIQGRHYRFHWDGRDTQQLSMASGVYLYRFNSSFQHIKKIRFFSSPLQ